MEKQRDLLSKNADSGEDVFWDTLLCVFNDLIMNKETTEVQIYKTQYFANIPKGLVLLIKTRYPNKKVMVSFKPKFNLKRLKDNQMCVRGDGKKFVFILEMIN